MIAGRFLSACAVKACREMAIECRKYLWERCDAWGATGTLTSFTSRCTTPAARKSAFERLRDPVFAQ
jgi:hypothetical protein